MLLLLISMFCINEPRVDRVVKKDMSERHYAAGLMRNQLHLSSQHSGQCEIGAHLPNLIFLRNRLQLLLPILCSHSYSFALYFFFHLSLGFCCFASVKYLEVFPHFNLLHITTQHLCCALLLCNFHSSFPFTQVYLRSFVHPDITVFYRSFNFFQPSYQLFSAPPPNTLGF